MSDGPTDIFARLGGSLPRRATVADCAILTTVLDERVTTLNRDAAKCLRRLNLLGYAFGKLAANAMQGTSKHIKAGRPVMLKRSKDGQLSIEKQF